MSYIIKPFVVHLGVKILLYVYKIPLTVCLIISVRAYDSMMIKVGLNLIDNSDSNPFR